MSVRFLSGVNVDSNTLVVDDVNNRVGIGTSTPAGSLHIYQPSGAGGFVLSRTNNITGVNFQLVVDSTKIRLIGYGDSLTFWTAAAGDGTNAGEKMRINASGNVGINTTNPGEKLQVIGNIGVGAGTYNGGVYANSSTSGVDQNWGFDIARTAGVADYSTRLKYYPNTGESRKGGIYNSLSNTWVLYGDSNNTPNVIVPTGSVGIGTTAPENRLHLGPNSGNVKLALEWSDSHSATSGKAYSTIYTSGQGGSYPFGGRGNLILQPRNTDSNGAGDLVVMTGATATPKLVVQASGNVGIGVTSPAFKLQVGTPAVVAGSDYAWSFDLTRANDTARGFSIGQGSGGGTAVLGSHNADMAFGHTFGVDANGNPVFYETMRIQHVDQAVGNVGIGTTSPGGRLHIATPDPATNFVVIDFRNPTYGIYGKSNSISGRGNTLEFTATDYNTNGSVVTRDVLTLRPEGNVGIGTTSPKSYSSLTTQGQIISLSNIGINIAQSFRLNNYYNSATVTDRTISTGYAASIGLDNSAGAMTFLTSASSVAADNNTSVTEKMRITGAGNVGIGTTAPLNLLHVSQPSANTVFRLGNNTTYDQFIYFNGNNDWSLGMDYSNSNAFVLSNSSSIGTNDRIVVTTGGNVGIGTTSPATVLHLNRTNVPYRGQLTIQCGPTSDFAQITFYEGATTQTDLLAQIYAASSDNSLVIGAFKSDGVIKFQTNNEAERMRITGAGNVGIGTTGPDTLLHLSSTTSNSIIRLERNSVTIATGESYGQIQWEGQDASNGAAGVRASIDTIANGSLGETNMVFRTSGSNFSANVDRLIITSSGNVGIGTTSPTVPLQIVNTNATISMTNSTAFAVDTGSRIFLGGKYSSATSNNTSAFAWLIGAKENATDGNQAGYLSFTTTENGGGFAERMRITSTGNVGIGTASPTFSAVSGNTVKGLHIQNIGNDTQASLRLTGHNNTGTPGQATFTELLHAGADLRFDINHNGAAALTINPSRNVGIGTTSPESTLHVSGTIRVDNIIGETYPSNTFIDFDYDETAWTNSLALGSIGSVFYLADTNNNSASTTPAHQFFTGTTDIDTATALMTIRTDGFVGIGTTTPGTELQVSGDLTIGKTGTDGRMLFTRPSDGATAAMFGYFSAANDDFGIENGSGGGNIKFKSNAGIFQFSNTATSELMRITAAGNVGIGTTSPSAKLHSEGKTLSRTTDSGWGQSAVANPNDSEVGFVWAAGGTGYPGVTSTYTRQWIAGLSPFGTGTDRWSLTNKTLGANTAITVLEGGNVGIGTISPVTKLQLSSATNAVDVFRIGNTAGDSGSVQGVTHLAINQFGAGTFPSTRITAYQDGVSGWPGGMYFSTRSLNTDSAPVERMRITSAGNVGIGTTSPNASYRTTITTGAGQTGALQTTGSVNINSGALAVGSITPSGTAGRIDASNDIVAFSTSDQRLKENITPIANALDKVKALTGVEFDWKEDTKHVHGYEGHDVGVIAQEVQAVLPEAIRTNESGYLSVRYEKMIALLIEANKELASEVEQLKTRLDGLAG